MLIFIFSLSFSLFLNNWGSVCVSLIFLNILFLLKRSEFSVNNYEGVFETDILSNRLIILRLWVVILAILARIRVKISENYERLFIFLNVSLLFFLFISFSLNNYLLFYIRFECTLIPILFLVLGWGYQPERLQASYYLIFYTLAASLPLLLVIIINYKKFSYFFNINYIRFGWLADFSVLFLILAFLAKFPIYALHLWLPKAHVEAPVAGSIILAGVLLKLGGYGIIRFFPMVKRVSFFLQSFLIILSVWGALLLRISCLCFMDIKLLIACSSVVHIRTCISCLLIINDWGLKRRILIILAHGVCSRGLFFLIGLIYNRTNRRSIIINKGLLNIIPSIRLWWFLLLSCNIAVPPSINLLSELSIISTIVNWRRALTPLLFFLTFFSASYTIYVYSLSQHGKFLPSKNTFNRGSILDYLVLFLHWAPLNIFILSVFYLICFFSL